MNKITAKIISFKEAKKMFKQRSGFGMNNSVLYQVVNKIGSNETVEIIKIDIKTNKKEIIFQTPEYNKVKQMQKRYSKGRKIMI